MRHWLNFLKRKTSPSEAWQPPRPSRLLMRALEPRLLFDGALAVDVVDHVASEPLPVDFTPPAVTPPAPRELVFVDANLPDTATLALAIRPGVEIHRIESGQDGLQVMANTLAGQHDIAAL